MKWFLIRRLACTNESCHSLHRELPDILAPFKHFESDIISGVLDRTITPDTKGFEDHPSESTMQHWNYWLQINKKNIDGILKSKGYQLLGFSEVLLTARDSLLEKLRAENGDWLRIILRFIYNSGGSLQSTWDHSLCTDF